MNIKNHFKGLNMNPAPCHLAACYDKKYLRLRDLAEAQGNPALMALARAAKAKAQEVRKHMESNQFRND